MNALWVRISRSAYPLLATVMLATRGAAQRPDSTWRDHARALDQAIARQDTAAYRSELTALQRMVGTTPRLASRLAIAALATHDTAAEARWIATRAAMGLAWDTAAANRYSLLRGSGATAELQRRNLANSSAIDHSELLWTLADAGMLAEDLTYDGRHRRLLISSVQHGGVVAVGVDGSTAPVLRREAGDWGTFAIGVDSSRSALWLSSAALRGSAGFSTSDSGRSALREYDLNSGKLRRQLVAPDTGAHVLGDIVVTSSGTVYVSDGLHGGVYEAGPGATSLHTILPAGTLSSPQTPALSRDGRTLFVPDYASGIAVVDLATRQWHWMHHADTLALTGIDGLYRHGDDLIAVQNGLEPSRIVRLVLDAGHDVIAASTLARGGSARDINHGVIVDDEFWFIAQAGWDRMSDSGELSRGTGADAPQIRKVKIR